MLVSPIPINQDRARRLTESDAVDIWIARWMRVRRRELCRRYNCDPRRLYEIWEGTKFKGSREKAIALLATRYPMLIERIDAGPHRRIARTVHPDQLSLLEGA